MYSYVGEKKYGRNEMYSGEWEKRKDSPDPPRVPQLSGRGATYSQGGKNGIFENMSCCIHG